MPHVSIIPWCFQVTTETFCHQRSVAQKQEGRRFISMYRIGPDYQGAYQLHIAFYMQWSSFLGYSLRCMDFNPQIRQQTETKLIPCSHSPICTVVD